MRTLFVAAFLITGIHALAQYTPASVPNTKLINNSYVSNPDQIIRESTVAQIDSLLSDLEQKTTAQIAVIVLDSIGDADIFDFTQELFNLWGIGGSNNNGLMILLAKDKRTVRFHTGYALEGPLPDVVCKQIQRDKMVPAFKEGDYDAGMLAGVQEVHKILTDPAYAAEIKYASNNDVSAYTGFVIFMLITFGTVFLITWAVKVRRFSNSKRPAPTEFPQMRLKRGVWMMEFGGIPLLILLGFWLGPVEGAVVYCITTIYLYYMATIFHRIWRERKMIKGFIEKRQFFEAAEYIRESQWYWLFIALIFPIPFIGYFPFHLMRKRYYRNHPRYCKLCDEKMIKLSEIEDDQHLTKNQQLEESIESINYDVWKCTGCAATEGWAFPDKFSKYKICPACKTVAYYVHSDKTLVSPTYSSSGKGEEIQQCKACNKKERKTYAIAKLVRTSSSGGSSGYSSSSSGGSGGGGSWGGGSSGGGGASSSW
ncbi:MAG TPA: TPM domain-containing protein [Cyclobacteriaceae bacterium]|nr:TPM domain-containing protein [Cyclobacteriaceae bacterium]